MMTYILGKNKPENHREIMDLNEWLKKEDIPLKDFCDRVDVSAEYLRQITKDPNIASRRLLWRIYRMTGEKIKLFDKIKRPKEHDERRIVSAIYRPKALKNYPHICFSCKNKKKHKLEAHHIDGNRKNNEVSNLCLVCKKCHNSIHNFAKKHKISLEKSLKYICAGNKSEYL